MTALALGLGAAHAQSAPSQRDWTLDHFRHRAFTEGDGLPPGATAFVAQTADGLLWEVGDGGLYNFDGTHFREFTPFPGEAVSNDVLFQLFAPASGGLWMVYRKGNLDLVHDGHITSYRDALGKGKWKVTKLFKGPDGLTWAVANQRHFLRFDGTKWTMVSGLTTPDDVRGIASDAAGTLWVVGRTNGGIYRRKANEAVFADLHVQVADAFSISVPAPDVVFVSALSKSVSRFRVVADTLVGCGSPLAGLAASVVPDGHGGGWMATAGDGLHYLPSLEASCPVPPALPRDSVFIANKASGATGDTVLMALVDREGNIWSTSENGLDRYTRSAFSRVRFPTSINMATIAAAPDGSLYVGNESADVLHYSEDMAVTTGVAPAALALAASASTRQVVAASTTGVWAFGTGAPKLLAPLPQTAKTAYPNAVYREPSPETDPRIWLSVNDATFVLRDGSWATVEKAGGATAIYGDGQGKTWLALPMANALVSSDAGGLRQWTQADGVDVGRVKVVTSGPAGTWFAGDEGIQLLAGGKFRNLRVTVQPAPQNITGLVFDKDNALWIQTNEGLYGIPADAVARFVAGGDEAVPATLFRIKDGLPGEPTQMRSLPSLVAGTDGRIWVQGGTAVVWFDPHDLPPTPAPSAPVVTRMTVGGQRFEVTGPAPVLSRDQRSPYFAYAAPAMTDASVVRYQTRLSGFDDAWVDQGTRREVGYPRIPAGRYVFSVRASTDGVNWTKAPPRLAFAVEPYFFETWWFIVLCGALALFAVWLLARWEIRRALRRYRARLKIRLDEREAIARDLHDTLLQSNLALVLQLEAACLKTPDPVARARLTAIADRANEAMLEGRMKVSALREQFVEGEPLCTRLRLWGEELSAQTGVEFELLVEGHSRALKDMSAEILRLLLAEAMANAFRHANAGTVVLLVSFDRWRFRASVRDDGDGLPPEVASSGRRDGHWGIPGMRERARDLHGTLRIRPVTPKGTDVRVSVPGRHIYAQDGGWHVLEKGHP
jgi:signal transduction histidine kinase/streptogramin lyase